MTTIRKVDPRIVQCVALRMLDHLSPVLGYFAFTGEQYRRIAGHSADEPTIEETIRLARERAAEERRRFAEGAREISLGTAIAGWHRRALSRARR